MRRERRAKRSRSRRLFFGYGKANSLTLPPLSHLCLFSCPCLAYVNGSPACNTKEHKKSYFFGYITQHRQASSNEIEIKIASESSFKSARDQFVIFIYDSGSLYLSLKHRKDFRRRSRLMMIYRRAPADHEKIFLSPLGFGFSLGRTSRSRRLLLRGRYVCARD